MNWTIWSNLVQLKVKLPSVFCRDPASIRCRTIGMAKLLVRWFRIIVATLFISSQYLSEYRGKP